MFLFIDSSIEVGAQTGATLLHSILNAQGIYNFVSRVSYCKAYEK